MENKCDNPNCAGCTGKLLDSNGDPVVNLQRFRDSIATPEGLQAVMGEGNPGMPDYLSRTELAYVMFAKERMAFTMKDTLPHIRSAENELSVWHAVVDYAVKLAAVPMFIPVILPQPEQDAEYAAMVAKRKEEGDKRLKAIIESLKTGGIEQALGSALAGIVSGEAVMTAIPVGSLPPELAEKLKDFIAQHGDEPAPVVH